MIARLSALLLVLIASLLLAVGCGDDDSSSTDTGSSDDSSGQTLELGVDGNNLAFDKTELTATAGSVTLKLDNTSSIQHNVAIESEDGEELEVGDLVGADESSEITVDLEPGTYTYFCSPHKSSGMTGTLTVT